MLAEHGILPEHLREKPVEAPPRGHDRFEVFAERWLGNTHARTRATTRSYTSWLKHSIPYFGQMKICDITSATVDDGFAQLPKKASRRHWVKAVSMVMERAVTTGEIDRNPVRGKGLSRLQPTKKKPQHWADLRMLVDFAADQQMRALLWTLAGTGMRIGEALALDWSAIDLDAGVIVVHQHATPHGIEMGFKHSENDERTVVMFPEAVQEYRPSEPHEEARQWAGSSSTAMATD